MHVQQEDGFSHGLELESGQVCVARIRLESGKSVRQSSGVLCDAGSDRARLTAANQMGAMMIAARMVLCSPRRKHLCQSMVAVSPADRGVVAAWLAAGPPEGRGGGGGEGGHALAVQ